MKILLVEDDRELNRTLLFQLEKEGFLVEDVYKRQEYYIPPAGKVHFQIRSGSSPVP